MPEMVVEACKGVWLRCYGVAMGDTRSIASDDRGRVWMWHMPGMCRYAWFLWDSGALLLRNGIVHRTKLHVAAVMPTLTGAKRHFCQPGQSAPTRAPQMCACPEPWQRPTVAACTTHLTVFTRQL